MLKWAMDIITDPSYTAGPWAQTWHSATVQAQTLPRPSTGHPDQHSSSRSMVPGEPTWFPVPDQTPSINRALAGNWSHRHYPRPQSLQGHGPRDPDMELGSGPCLDISKAPGGSISYPGIMAQDVAWSLDIHMV